MKAESTIKKMISRLKKISEDENQPEKDRTGAYDSYHALRWVVEDVSWTPMSLYKEK